MKRSHSKAFQNDRTEKGSEPERKLQSCIRTNCLCPDVVDIILSYTLFDDCARARLVCKDWNEKGLRNLERSNVHLHLVGNSPMGTESLSERECIIGLLNVQTVYNVGSWKIRDLPNYFRGLFIEGICSREMSSLFTPDLGNVKNITIYNCFVGDACKSISDSHVERIEFCRSSIDEMKRGEFPSLKSFVAFRECAVPMILFRYDYPIDKLDGFAFSKHLEPELNRVYHLSESEDLLFDCSFMPKTPIIISFCGYGGIDPEYDYSTVEKVYIDMDYNCTNELLNKMSVDRMPKLNELWITFKELELSEDPEYLSFRKLVICDSFIDIESLFRILEYCTELEELCLMECALCIKGMNEIYDIDKGRVEGHSLKLCDHEIIIPDINNRDRLGSFRAISKNLSIFKACGCKLKSLVIDSLNSDDIALYLLLNCPITENLQKFYCTRNIFRNHMTESRVSNRTVTNILLESGPFPYLTTFVTDTLSLSGRELDRGSRKSIEHLLLNNNNMPKLRHLTIDMSRNPKKASSMGVRASKLENITISTLSTCLDENDINFVVLSRLLPYISVLSNRNTENDSHDSDYSNDSDDSDYSDDSDESGINDNRDEEKGSDESDTSEGRDE